ncbi:MAG TPA: nucleotidyltransferase family protein [Casimicrobiaceae bacterium]|jgi:hypothetical protein|nr:nucleotidyltransferase family protein [Casimicrobiaceae bacterium]
MTTIGGGWRPDAGQELLLAATVGPADRAAAAFAQWRRTHDIDTLDAGSTRLLPLLVPRQPILDADDAPWTVIRGVYRRAFVHGQLVCRRAGDAIARLASANIDAMALKGGALIAYYDGNPALRPMNDFDVLVGRASAVAAIGTLTRSGWRAQWPRPERLPEAYHGACFVSPDDLDLDLHWSALPSDEGAFDTELWQASRPGTIPGIAVRAPCAPDLLAIVCAHAAAWQPVSPVRWVADAIRIVGDDAAAFDWARVVDAARAWRVTLQLADTLDYLAGRWGIAVPPATLAALRATPVGRIDRQSYAAAATMPGTADYLMRPWRRYRLRARHVPGWRALPGFVRYLEITMGLRDWRELPREIALRLRRFRRDRRLGLR